MARPGQIDDLRIALRYEPVQVDVDEAKARRCSPVTEQARLDVLDLERLAQQRFVLQIDLPDRQVVGSLPVLLHPLKELTRQRPLYPSRSYGARGRSVRGDRAGYCRGKLVQSPLLSERSGVERAMRS